MNRRLVIRLAIAAALLGGVGYGGFAWFQARQRAAVLAEAVPPQPPLTGMPDAFRARITACEQRVAAGADALAALGELSRLYHANGFHAEAARCYTALQQLAPDDARWPHRHATILAGFGDLEDAIPLWERVVALAPDYVPARIRLADALFKTNQVAAARKCYEAVLRRDPQQPHAEFGLARCDFEAGNWAEARERLERLVARTNHRLGYDLLVTVCERQGDRARAAALRGREQASGAYRDPADPWIDELIHDCYDPFRLSLVAGFRAAAGHTAEAVELLERALSHSPENHALHFQLAGVHLAARSYSKARQHFEKCTQLEPEFPDGWFQLSELCRTLGDRAGAEQALAEGLRHCPNSPGLHQLAARRHEQAGRIEEAVSEYRRSAELRPNEAGARVELARLLIREGRLEEARTELRQALAAEPDHPGALGILAFDAITQGDEAAARALLDQAARQPRIPADQRATLLQAFRDKFGHTYP